MVLPGEEFEEAQDFSSEPLESRFESKDLNRRCSAYSEAAAEMGKAGEDASAEDACFALFRKHVPTCLGETLPKGQDAALSALTVYLEKCPGLEGEASAPEVLGLVRKLIEHKSIDKPKMQQLAPSIVVLVAEICECPGVVKEIVDCLGEVENAKKKTQGFLKKQIAFAIKLFCQLIADFGLPKMSSKLGYLPVVLKYLSDSDRGIREACYSVVLELSAWMGDLPDAAKSLEEPQKKELMKRLSALSDEEKSRTEAKRVYRSERGKLEAEGSGGAATNQFARAETVDALRKLPRGWSLDKVFSMEKWKEKQAHLQILSSAVDCKRLAPCEGYAALVPALSRILKNESNIPVLTEAAKCVGLIAAGLRSEFDRPARQLLPSALTRIIDKSVWKPNILIDKIEQMLWAVPFEVFLEELRQYMHSKSTWAKKEAMSLILKTMDLPQVQESCPDAAQRFFPTLAASVLPAADDSDNGVRHEACRFLAVLAHKNLSSPNLGPMILERYPMHRQSGFEEEWRKLGVSEPCPLSASGTEDRVRATSQSSMGSRRGGGEAVPRSRPTSPLQARGGSPRRQARPTSPMRQDRPVPESPSKTRQPVSAAKPGRDAPGRGCAPLRARSTDTSVSQLDDQSILEYPVVKEMAEEIKILRARLAEQPVAAPSPAPAPAAASTQEARPESRMRQPSEGRSGAVQPRGLAPATPRHGAAPVRAHSAGRAEEHEAPAPDRRLSGPRAGECTALRPTQRAPVASGRPSTPRASSGEARVSRDGSGPIRRDNSANALAPTPGVGFEINPPRVAKQVRQQRDRCQHWGPDPIAAEFLTSMRESWKSCVNERLFRCMFSDRMEEQLLSLQTWKYQVTEHVEAVVEVLDMLLKWLTWMLFNTNTQIWKLALEVFGSLLDRLAAIDVQLTDREAHILATNILERSGHNIQSVREGMMVISRQILWVYPRLKLLPLILLGLLSKNKRSATCAMRLLCDTLDRQVASTLARSQKDLSVVLRMVDDKDPEVRRAAVHATASLSQHLDSATFDRIVNSIPKSTQPIIRTAASRLPPGGLAEDSQLCASDEKKPLRESTEVPSSAPSRAPPRTIGMESPGPRIRRSGCSNSAAGLASPKAHVAQSPTKAPSRPITPMQGRPEAVEAAVPAAAQQAVAAKAAAASCSQGQLQSQASHASSPSTATSTESSQALAQRLLQCGGEDFKVLCGTLKQRARQGVLEGDAIHLAEALVHAMRAYFGHDGCADRCMPLVEMLDEFCATKECLRPLPTSLLRGMLKEQLRNLQYSSWTKRVDDGARILRTLNLSCVMLLNGINRSIAYSLLLELGTEESEAVHSSLVVKCLRKLNKSLGTSRNPEVEVQSALDVVRQWLQKVHPRLAQADGREKGMVESAAAALLDGAKEVVDAAKTACPAAATAWAIRHESAGEEGRLVREWVLNGTSVGEKENQPSAAPGVAPQKLDPNMSGLSVVSPKREGGATPLKRRASSPAHLTG